MIAESLLTCLFIAAGGTIGYLLYDYLAVRRRRSTPHGRGRTRLRGVLMKALKLEGLSAFRLSKFVACHGLSPEETKHACEAVFLSLCGRVVSDGVVTDSERRNLERLASRLELDAGRSADLLESAKVDRLRIAAGEAADDGTVTAEEASDLEVLRRSLDIDAGDSDEVVREAVTTNKAERSRRRRFVVGGVVAGLLVALPLWSKFWPERSAAANGTAITRESESAEPSAREAVAATAASRSSRLPAATGDAGTPSSSPTLPAGAAVAETSDGGSYRGTAPGNGYDQSYAPYYVPQPRYVPSRSSGSDDVVHVKGYYRKDGTYVRPHTRKAPTSKSSAPSYSRKSSRRR